METNKETTVENPYGFIYITTNMKNGMKYLGQRKFNQGWQSYLGSGMRLKKRHKNIWKIKF